MIKVEGYKAFRGIMRITPQRLGWQPFDIEGEWLYKPEADCWYCNGSSYMACICEVVVDYTE